MSSARRISETKCTPEEHARRSARASNEQAARERGNVLRAVARTFVAAGDACRLRLLVLLLDRPMTTRDLAAQTGRTGALVTQQMRVLRTANLVMATRTGREVVYAIVDRSTQKLLRTCIEHALTTRRGPR